MSATGVLSSSINDINDAKDDEAAVMLIQNSLGVHRAKVSGHKLRANATKSEEYCLKYAWAEGYAADCENLGCFTAADGDAGGLAECKTHCDGLSECNVINFAPTGSDATSGEGRCCSRRCNYTTEDAGMEYPNYPAHHQFDLELVQGWKGWDIYTIEPGSPSGSACGGTDRICCSEPETCSTFPGEGITIAPSDTCGRTSTTPEYSLDCDTDDWLISPPSGECAQEYENAGLDGFCSRCESEGGASPMRKTCTLCSDLCSCKK